MTQQEALDILKTGANVFLTGAAGSGKTYVLRQYIAYLHDHHIPVAVTASTGIAATHIGGITIHSWAGIGIHDALDKYELHALFENTRARKRIERPQVLIIDEISMLHHFRFDLVDQVARLIRNVEASFGGLQVVVCGDFFQLPPVRKEDEPDAKFAYHASAWDGANFSVCYLEEQHRQSDMAYLSVLHRIRDGRVTENEIQLLHTRLHASIISEVRPTVLYAHNANVDAENNEELERLSGKVTEYYMTGTGRKNYLAMLEKNCLAPRVLRLKKGARVMFVKNNFEEGYVNGTLGIIEHCSEGSIRVRIANGTCITVPKEAWAIEEDGKTLAEISQYPLRLAWAITIHKSKGMSLDAAEIDLCHSFEKGMGYVALSRVKTLQGLSLLGINDVALQVHDEALMFDAQFRESSRICACEIHKISHSEKTKKIQTFVSRAKTTEELKEKKDTITQTKELFTQGMSLEDIAQARGMTKGTILEHFEKIHATDININFSFVTKIIIPTRLKAITDAFAKARANSIEHQLSYVKSLLGDTYSYEEIRLARLLI